MTRTSETETFKTNASMEIKLLRAQDWFADMKICNEKDGKVLFRVDDNVNDGTDKEPRHKMFLTDEKGEEVLSAVKMHRGAFSSCWQIFTKDPNYEGQPRGIQLSGETSNGHNIQQDMFLHSKLYFTSKKVYRIVKENGKQGMEKIVWKRKSVKGGKCCKCDTKRVITFCDYKNPDDIVFTRDQINETLSIAAGKDALVAVSLAYAVDRLSKFGGSKEEFNDRPQSASRTVVPLGAILLGCVGAFIAGTIADKTDTNKKVQRGDIIVEDYKQQ